MLNFGNKEFRNLQEQVLYNANSIEEIKQGLGDALPNPIPGPEGPQGSEGPQGECGERGSVWTIGTDFPLSPKSNDIHLKPNGEVYQFLNDTWTLYSSIKGNTGVKGAKGDVGPQGPEGPQGPQGPQGLPSSLFKFAGIVETELDLPLPETVAPDSAFLVKNWLNTYDIYIITPEGNWRNAGAFTTDITDLIKNYVDTNFLNINGANAMTEDLKLDKGIVFNQSNVGNNISSSTNGILMRSVNNDLILGNASLDKVTLIGSTPNLYYNYGDQNSELVAFQSQIQNLQPRLTPDSSVSIRNLTVANKIKSNLTPDFKSGSTTFNLGSTSKPWEHVYAKKINLDDTTVLSKDNEYISIGAENSALGTTIFANAHPIIESRPDKQDQVVIRDLNDNKVIVVPGGSHKTGLKLGYQTILAGGGQIELCPHGKDSDRGYNFSPADTNRIKLGGGEYVNQDDQDNESPTPIIFAYKPANSDGEIVPFAITEEGDIYYHGEGLINNHLYHHIITIAHNSNSTRKFFLNFYTRSSEQFNTSSLWNFLISTYSGHRVDATGNWNNNPVLGFEGVDEDENYKLYFWNAETSAYSYNQIDKTLTGYTVNDFVRIVF